MTPFVPAGQSVPKPPSDYLKLEDGENKVRILADSIGGWKWQDSKTDEWHFSEDKPKVTVGEVKTDMFGNPSLRFFISAPVWSYRDEDVKIMEVTQTGIMNDIEALENDSDWGDVKSYDLKITKKGKGKETRYTVNGNPNKEEIKQEWLDMLEEKRKEEKENGGHKFRCKWDTTTETPPAASTEPQEEEIDDSSLPF